MHVYVMEIARLPMAEPVHQRTSMRPVAKISTTYDTFLTPVTLTFSAAKRYVMTKKRQADVYKKLGVRHP